MQQMELFSGDTAARLFAWPGFPEEILPTIRGEEGMVIELLEQLIKLARDLKPTDRSEKARKYAILITELEKIHAYAKEYGL